MKALKRLAVLGLLAFAVIFGTVQYRKRQLIHEENRATALYNDGEYRQALDAYLALLPKHGEADAARVRKLVAKCYVRRAENPELSGSEQAALARKALEYDPESIDDPVLLRLTERLPASSSEG